jgi:hypothetical protein
LPTLNRSHFLLNCSDELTEQGEWLCALVERIGQKQSSLVDGAAFQVGWSVLKLVRTIEGLVLCEPDFDNDPFRNFRKDVSATLAVVSAQRDLVSKVGCSPVDIRFDDKVVMLKGCLESPGIYAERSDPKKGDSGWYLGPTSERPAPTVNDLEAVWAFELLRKRPHLLSAMCLPANWMVVWNGTEIVGIADPNNQERLR